MALTVTLGGVEFTSKARVGSLSITDSLNSNRNTASLTLIEEQGAEELVTDANENVVTNEGDKLMTGYRPVAGESIVIQKDGTTVFAGTIDEVSEEKFDGATPALRYSLKAVDWNQLTDRHLVAKAYETPGQTVGDIVRDIVTTFLAGEGVTTTGVQDGPTIDKAVFNYRTAADALDELAEVTGFLWWIDYDKVMHFSARETNVAPWGLTDTSGNFRNLRVKSTRKQYRNRQWVRAGFDITDERTETFVGDGERKTFTTAYPLAKVPTIDVDGTPKTVGIKGVDTGKDFYWNKESNEITQDDSATALTGSQVLSVAYQGLFPIILSAQDDAGIAAMAEREGGTGVYEDIVDEPNIDQLDMATAKGNALLRRFGRFPLPRVIEFETDDDGLEAGQLMPVTIGAHVLAGNYLIEEVRARDRNGKTLVYTVKALDGESLGGWEGFFKGLGNVGRSFVVRENEVVTYLRRSKETVTVTDTLSYTTSAPVSMCGLAMCGFSEVSA